MGFANTLTNAGRAGIALCGRRILTSFPNCITILRFSDHKVKGGGLRIEGLTRISPSVFLNDPLKYWGVTYFTRTNGMSRIRDPPTCIPLTFPFLFLVNQITDPCTVKWSL